MSTGDNSTKRDWIDSPQVREDVETVIGNLPRHQRLLLNRLARPGWQAVTRAELAVVRTVNWLFDSFWYRTPLLRIGNPGVVMAPGARAAVRAAVDRYEARQATGRDPARSPGSATR
ncbi:hypothetical protein ABZ342_38235 [Amycolatopsis sp. NPDC005961]|uniref:hypothetical protein n=1 Tax=Amycolatopsis sp. NPDC005961 TaxID=3156720 RepID=UPI0033F57B1A